MPYPIIVRPKYRYGPSLPPASVVVFNGNNVVFNGNRVVFSGV